MIVTSMTFKVNGRTQYQPKGMPYTPGVMALNAWMGVVTLP